MMKQFKLLIFSLITLMGATSCEDDDLEFIATEPSDEVSFTSTLANEYLLSTETSANNADRLVWSTPDFGVDSPVSYVVEGATTSTFDAIDYTSGTLSDNNHAIKVADLLTMAGLLGLDDDPETTDEAGNANNTGTVHFRVHAFLGTDVAAATVSSTSEVAIMNISIVEQSVNDSGPGIEIATWGVVGSGYNNWGAFPDAPFYTTSEAGVFVSYVNLVDGEIKFRENNDWTVNLGDTDADGTLEQDGDNIVVTAGDYKITLNINESTYTIEAFSLGIVGSAWNDWGNAGPDAKLFYDYTSDTFVVGVKLQEGEMKVRLNNDWSVNYGDTGADGTIEQDGDNILVTAGFYQIRVDLNNLTIVVEEAAIYGVVGSGYNDWGGAGPDFSFTQINPGYWKAENITLLDGEIKFRINEDWTVNLGDTGLDGILEQDGDNIPSTAGLYDIYLDLTDDANMTYSMIAK